MLSARLLLFSPGSPPLLLLLFRDGVIDLPSELESLTFLTLSDVGFKEDFCSTSLAFGLLAGCEEDEGKRSEWKAFLSSG